VQASSSEPNVSAERVLLVALATLTKEDPPCLPLLEEAERLMSLAVEAVVHRINMGGPDDLLHVLDSHGVTVSKLQGAEMGHSGLEPGTSSLSGASPTRPVCRPSPGEGCPHAWVCAVVRPHRPAVSPAPASPLTTGRSCSERRARSEAGRLEQTITRPLGSSGVTKQSDAMWGDPGAARLNRTLECASRGTSMPDLWVMS
jgi:hypothetical protein